MREMGGTGAASWDGLGWISKPLQHDEGSPITLLASQGASHTPSTLMLVADISITVTKQLHVFSCTLIKPTKL